MFFQIAAIPGCQWVRLHMLLDCNPMQEECATQGIVGQPPFVAWMEGYNSLLQLEIQSSKSKVLSKVMYD